MHEDLKIRLLCCARNNTPLNVKEIKWHRRMSGVAIVNKGIIKSPKPLSRISLYYYLHECAHMALHATGNKPRHVEEMEAEKWAMKKMREAGIHVPRKLTRLAKEHVHRHIYTAVQRGAKKIDKDAAQFAKFCIPLY
jgi:hypothetical protein